MVLEGEKMKKRVKVKTEVFENLLDDWANSNISELSRKLGISRYYIYQVLYDDISVGKTFIDKVLNTTALKFDDIFYYEENNGRH